MPAATEAAQNMLKQVSSPKHDARLAKSLASPIPIGRGLSKRLAKKIIKIYTKATQKKCTIVVVVKGQLKMNIKTKQKSGISRLFKSL